MTQAEKVSATRRLEELERLHLLPEETLRELRSWWEATLRREARKVVSIEDYRARRYIR